MGKMVSQCVKVRYLIYHEMTLVGIGWRVCCYGGLLGGCCYGDHYMLG